jgi:hypothetical protein
MPQAVVDAQGRPRTNPLIPFWDGEKVLMTSSVLFSRKLQDLKRNPKVSVSLSDPVGVPAQPFFRATIQGDATSSRRTSTTAGATSCRCG